MTDSPTIRENPAEAEGVPLAAQNEPVELDYAARGRRRDLSTPLDRGVMRVLMYGMMFAVLAPVVLGAIAIVAALLIS